MMTLIFCTRANYLLTFKDTRGLNLQYLVLVQTIYWPLRVHKKICNVWYNVCPHRAVC